MPSVDFAEYSPLVYVFFFQAEDGMRDSSVTGVQTCALPISATASWNEAATSAVVTLTRMRALDEQTRADVAASFQEAVADVLVAKSLAAVRRTALERLVVAGGGGGQNLPAVPARCAPPRATIQGFHPAEGMCPAHSARMPR